MSKETFRDVMHFIYDGWDSGDPPEIHEEKDHETDVDDSPLKPFPLDEGINPRGPAFF